jgi:hypothetical protein
VLGFFPEKHDPVALALLLFGLATVELFPFII